MMRARLKRKGQFRPLPLAISMMGLLVICKLAALVQGVATPALVMAGRIVLPMAHASSPAQTPTAGASSPSGAGATAQSHIVSSVSTAQSAGAVQTKPSSEPMVSQAELAVLQDLRSRRLELDGRADALKAREQLINAAEQRMSERVAQLTALQTRLEALDQTRRERDDANWQSLVKTYEKMRPRDAATIFNDLDETVLMQVLDRMKVANAALILGLMQPEQARLATTHLAEWRQRVPSEVK